MRPLFSICVALLAGCGGRMEGVPEPGVERDAGVEASTPASTPTTPPAPTSSSAPTSPATPPSTGADACVETLAKTPMIDVPGATPDSDPSGCTLFGVWLSEGSAHGSAPASSGYFRFDGGGSFIGAPTFGTCTARMHGTYRLRAGEFEMVTSEGMGCPSSYTAGWAVDFSDACRTVKLTPKWDNCTGGRHSITDKTVLTKKKY